MARQAGYRAIEINASDDRTGNVLTNRVVAAMESQTLTFEEGEKQIPNCVILDEVDGADARSAITPLVNIIKAPLPSLSLSKSSKSDNPPFLQRPLIFICNHKFAPALKPLLPHALIFDLHAPPAQKIVSRLSSICSQELLTVQSNSLSHLVQSSSGDIRR